MGVKNAEAQFPLILGLKLIRAGKSIKKGREILGKGNVFCETTPIIYDFYVDNATIENLTRETLEHTVGF